MSRARTIIGILSAGLLTCAQGQWLNHPDPSTPRSRDGKPVLTAPAPRRNGKPDLSGVWSAKRSLADFPPGEDPLKIQVDGLDVSILINNFFRGMKRADEPLTPAAREILAKRREATAFPPARCLPVGIPGSMLVYAIKMIQTPTEVL